MNPRRPGLLVDLAAAYARLGQKARARQLLDSAIAAGKLEAGVTFSVAAAYEDIGDRDSALEWLGRARKAGYPMAQVERSPGLAELRKDSRFPLVLHP